MPGINVVIILVGSTKMNIQRDVDVNTYVTELGSDAHSVALAMMYLNASHLANTMKDKQKLKSEFDEVIQAIITELNKKDKKTKDVMKYMTQLNFKIYDYHGFNYDPVDFNKFIKDRKVAKDFWTYHRKFAGKVWVAITCEVAFLGSFFVYINRYTIELGWMVFALLLFLKLLYSYVDIIGYLLTKEFLSKECVDVNIIIKFDERHWIKYAVWLSILVFGIWGIAYHSNQDWGLYYTSIMSPFFGIAGAFISNVIEFQDGIYSLHDFVQNLKNGVMDKGFIMIIPERSYFINVDTLYYRMITFYKQVSSDSRLWKFIVVPTDVLTMDIKNGNSEKIEWSDHQKFFRVPKYHIYNNAKLDKHIKSNAVLK